MRVVRGNRRRLRCRGFTLVELMVVLVIIGILSAAMLPQMTGTMEEVVLRATSRKLIAALQLAQSQAITVNQPHRLFIDQTEHRYQIQGERYEPEVGKRYFPVPSLPGASGSLNSRITISVQPSMPEIETSAGPAENSTDPLSASTEEGPAERLEAIEFYPNGSAQAAELLLRDRQGFGVALSVHPITGRVKVRALKREALP